MKKRSKKLLSAWLPGTLAVGSVKQHIWASPVSPGNIAGKSFLLLFFKKEALAFPSVVSRIAVISMRRRPPPSRTAHIYSHVSPRSARCAIRPASVNAAAGGGGGVVDQERRAAFGEARLQTPAIGAGVAGEVARHVLVAGGSGSVDQVDLDVLVRPRSSG